MTTTIVFDLISALVDTCTATVPAGVDVFDGQTAVDNPGNFLMVGVGNPDSSEPSESAAGTQEWHGIGAKASLEDGTVTCCALAWNGNMGNAAQKAARQSVRDLVAGVDAALKANPNLAGVVPGLMWVRYGQSFHLTQLSGDDGVAAIFYFEIAYKARLI